MGEAPGRGGRPRWQLLLIIVAIVLGVGLSAVFTLRSARSFRELEYIRRQGFDEGTAGVEAIRPWMTLRFVAVAYAVPEEYLYSALAIPFERRNADQSLGELNRIYALGLTPGSSELAILDRARAAIKAYRADPVATGLRGVREWMSVRYVASSTGLAPEAILEAAGLPAETNQSKPLGLVAEELRYPGGGRALAEAIQAALAALGVAP